ncbi:glycosyl hydrolase family 8 [Pelagovum pacificum]|uniref:cellulase n=1 Tax=Pelagovum pacificum TaxID=2588711 RepID=A0A5C5GFY0_9RHOB|nr:glycosyl hydrolase family 8 [Pelagovum pacificum]QQA44020.1 glycosyl hydrolase family 5 [Pelagovum pacificum]TNY32851.1 glycosyl hydrolase family 5 [Pelagovum pacificum]
MRRRTVLGLTACFAATGFAGSARAASDGWADWSEAFLLPEGRVVDGGQNGVSHSEGQGYGLLLAQANGDRAAFERMELWTRANLAVRQDHLLAWLWSPEGFVTDWRNATDGDLFRAWALLRADRDSGWTGHRETAELIVRDLSSSCLWPDPRAPAELLLRPGAESRIRDGRVLVNPSYYMTRALRELGEAFDAPRLVRAADHGETLLAELAEGAFLPDWIDVTEEGFAEPEEHDLRSAYDAIRIPLYLAWSGRRDHPAAGLGVTAFALDNRTVATHIGSDGETQSRSDFAGYRAVLALGGCGEIPQYDKAQPYYPATLHQLAEVAFRESSDC